MLVALPNVKYNYCHTDHFDADISNFVLIKLEQGEQVRAAKYDVSKGEY